MATRRKKIARNYVIVRGKRVYGAAAEAVSAKRRLAAFRKKHGSRRKRGEPKWWSSLPERKSCRRPGEYKPGGGRYAKKTCVPRKRSRKRHRAGQFKPGGGRYVTTTGGRKTKKRKPVRGSAESMSIF